MAADGITRIWRPSWPCSVQIAWRPLRRGSGDPTYRIDAAGSHWRGIRTPIGPATLVVAERRGHIEARAWGVGADHALESLPAMLGDLDDPTGFVGHHPQVAEAMRRHPHLRIGRTGLVFEALVPAVIEQKVTGKEAFGGFGALVRRFGESAPGPGREIALWVPPSAEDIRRVPSWEWLRMSIDSARSRTVVATARVANSLDKLPLLADPVEVDRRLRSIRGIGIWTSAEVRLRALGDADAVSFGDYHVAKEVGCLAVTSMTSNLPRCWRPTARTALG
jgi:3-methyladenine DNA glycosylase/8-oxoguanine DNA glycosylase